MNQRSGLGSVFAFIGNMTTNGNGKLDVNNLTSNQSKFLIWLSIPKYERFPATQKALAGELGVTEKTLCGWKKRLPQDAINQASREYLKSQFPEVLGSIADQATKGSYQHQRLFLELLGELSNDVNISVPAISFIVESRNGSNGDIPDDTATVPD